jgi:PEGA domain
VRAVLLTTLWATAWGGETPRVTLIVVGAEAARVEAAMAHGRDLPVELVVGHLPQAPAQEGARASLLSAARQSYVNGDFAGCLGPLGADGLVANLLSAGRRELAARVIFWRVACRVGSGALQAATDEARQFAALALEVPADAAEATPEVESLLGRAIKESASLPRWRLEVDAPPLRAGVSLDGRAGACVTPCSLEVLPGEHVITLDAEGYLPVTRRISVKEPAQVKLEATPAPPEVAAAQWSARYGASPWLYSEPSTRLLAQAIAARRLVLIHAEGGGELHLRGTLATDGKVNAQAERVARLPSLDAESRRLLRDLLVSGKVFEPQKPIYKRAAFWVPLVLAVSAAVISASIAASLKPNIQTRVGF